VLATTQPPPWVQAKGLVVPVFKPSVVQFFNDDLSDYYGNFNQVASAIYRQVLATRYPGGIVLETTTSKVG
jgi:hypothetical protein